MEEEEDESASSEGQNSKVALATKSARTTMRAHSSLEEGEVHVKTLPPSGDSVDIGVIAATASARFTERTVTSKKSTFTRSGTSSSSQESEAAVGVTQSTLTSGQYLAAARVETARSMESLRPSKDSSPARPASSCTTVRHATHRSFLTASERDVRETRGAPARRALSGEDVGSAAATAAERRRGLFASTERRALQQLSLPPPERRLTILSPHSPLAGTHELAWPIPPSLSGAGIRTRRKKGMVLPKLILPRSDSDQSDVFFDRCLIE